MWVFAALAQLVEQFIRNEKVASSIPASGTKIHQKARLSAKVSGFFVVCSNTAVFMERDMGRIAVLAGVAHDIAHHAASGLAYLSPHLALALRAAHQQATQMDMLDSPPYSGLVAELAPLRLALVALHITALRILQTYGLQAAELSSMVFHATLAPGDQQGYGLHTRMVIVAGNGKVFDSGWLS